MNSLTGSRIGRFEVRTLVGAGGMGAVYRAYDPRLRREVAIKVLPAAFSGDADRLQRFEREALAVARLAHPNILAIHDIGAHDGSPYLVTELLDGQTLRDHLGGQRLPLSTALDYAIQVAQGLATAHDHGIVHRDIKPENLFVTREGRVKILDFGIAKLTDASDAAHGDAATLTALGGAVGTAAYMSPEQAQGRPTDHRADLFSLGVVLYEMLSGVSPFQRASAPETMSAIIRDALPDFPEAVSCPPALARIVRHSVVKDPVARFQSARDLAFALETPEVSPQSASPSQRRADRVVQLLLASVALALLAAYLFERRAQPQPPADVTGVYRVTDFAGLEEFPAIAPDLKSIAFTARVDGTRQVFVRLVAGGTPLQVTKDAADHEGPRWSRDASAITYFSPAIPGHIQGTIWEIPALGGAPRRIMDSVGAGDIDRSGRLACFRTAGGETQLVSVSPDRSDVRVLARFSEPVYFKYPRWSADSKWIAYQRGDGVRWDIFIVPVAGGPARQLTQDNSQIHGLAWLPDGSGLVYSSSRGASMPYLPTLALWELPLDGREPRRIAPADVSYLHPDIHESGAMATTRLQMHFDLWSYPVAGSPTDNVTRAVRLTRQTGQVQTPTVGASDREVAFLSDSGGHANLWITTADDLQLRQVTHEREASVALGAPVWSPDGQWIAFVSSRGNRGLGFGVWAVQPDGGNVRNLAPSGLGMAWSPDARWVYYSDAGAVYKVAVGGGTPALVRPGPARNVIGHDGQTLYFIVDRTLMHGSPGFEIRAARPENGSARLIAQIPASRAPQWQIVNPSLSPDGSSLAMPLTDGVTTNIWTLTTADAQWRQVTDFGDTPTFIARRVSWSVDGRSILAAVGEGDADVVVFDLGRAGPRP